MSTQALQQWRSRRAFPTDMTSAQIRSLSRELRMRSVFSARMTNAEAVQELADVVDEMLSGKINMATGRLRMMRKLAELGYDPEKGFPGEIGVVPPAERGSLRDLSSERRIDLMLETNMRQCANFGFWKQGQSDFALFAYPCYELVRIYPRVVPRGMRLRQGALEHVRGEDWPSRWEAAGGTFTDTGRMIARKDDEIWGRLGSSELFPDALDTFIPPFAFGSGYGWREVDRAESIALGVIEEDTEVEGQRHSLNGNLVAPASLTVEMLDAALGDLEEYRDQLDQKIAAEKAAAAANPARKSKGPWRFTVSARNEGNPIL